MLISTEGLILNHTLLGEDDLIVKILTKELGLVSFFVKRAKKSKIKKYLQPLMNVSVSLKHKKNQNLQYIKDIELQSIPNEILINYKKRNCVLFLCEIISRSVQEGLKDYNVYNFIQTSLLFLNSTSLNGNYFDLWFLINFTKVLGVVPDYSNITNNTEIMFNPIDGTFYPSHLKSLSSCWDAKSSKLLFDFLHINIGNLTDLSLSDSYYKSLLDNILQYYSLHVSELNYEKPITVYKELL